MRYAIYFTPPENHPLTVAAGQWLGRDAFREGDRGNLPIPDDRHDLTADPRRYGFHATLKAPFELAEGKTEEELLLALGTFADRSRCFDIPRIVVGALGPFFALVPENPSEPLQNFATEAVEHFEPFRAALSEHDIARRKPEHLSERQRDNLMRWGYPYVMDEFRFHMTLTGPVDDSDMDRLRQTLEARFADFTHRPLNISGLALFVEKTRGAPFTVHTWLPLAQPEKKEADR